MLEYYLGEIPLLKVLVKVAIRKHWYDCLVYPTVTGFPCYLDHQCIDKQKRPLDCKLVKNSKWGLLRSSWSARIGKLPDTKAVVDKDKYLWCIFYGYNESLSDSGVVDIGLTCPNNDEAVIKLNNWAVDTVMVCFCAFVIDWGHTLGECSRGVFQRNSMPTSVWSNIVPLAVNKLVSMANRLPHF